MSRTHRGSRRVGVLDVDETKIDFRDLECASRREQAAVETELRAVFSGGPETLADFVNARAAEASLVLDALKVDRAPGLAELERRPQQHVEAILAKFGETLEAAALRVLPRQQVEALSPPAVWAREIVMEAGTVRLFMAEHNVDGIARAMFALGRWVALLQAETSMRVRAEHGRAGGAAAERKTSRQNQLAELARERYGWRPGTALTEAQWRDVRRAWQESVAGTSAASVTTQTLRDDALSLGLVVKQRPKRDR